MKYIFSLALCFLLVSCVSADAVSLNTDPQLREYLNSIENAIKGNTAYKSLTQTDLSTATVNATTTTVYVNVKLDNSQWFTKSSVSGFTVSTSGTGTGNASLVSSSLDFKSGSAGCGVILSGTWSIGDTVTVSFPALSVGVISSATGSKVLTFTQ